MPGRLVGETVDKRWHARLRPDALHARAAHPPRESHLEHLHQPGPGRAHGHDLSCTSTARKASASWRSRTCQSALRAQAMLARTAQAALRRRAALQRIRRADRRARRRDQRSTCSTRRSSAAFRSAEFYPELGNALLWCVHRADHREQIDRRGRGAQSAGWRGMSMDKKRSRSTGINRKSPRTSARTKALIFEKSSPGKRGYQPRRRSTSPKPTPHALLGDARSRRRPQHARGQRNRDHPPLHAPLHLELRHRPRHVSARQCTMKYNPRVNEVRRAPRGLRRRASLQPEIALAGRAAK